MSKSFEQRLYPILSKVVAHFGTPFHLYDEEGIIGTGQRLIKAFASTKFREFFSVKANPNPAVLKLILELGFGFDCSSVPELFLTRQLGAKTEDILFTSNNTTLFEFGAAMEAGGCILNLDDITLINKVPPPFPSLISFRYNPGTRRTGNSIIGHPIESKYGVSHEQIVGAYRRAMERGSNQFGIHTMICSNELNYEQIVTTVKMLLEVMGIITKEIGIKFKFLNPGGGLGIPYRLTDVELPIEKMATEIVSLLNQFGQEQGYIPQLFLESGRWMTGPHGVLVAQCVNQKNIYREYRGLDACMSDLMRPGLYYPNGGYHHITVLGKEDTREVVDVVGSLCENSDKFAVQRELPKMKEGDVVVIHDTGAHGHSMGFNYNGRLRHQELMLRRNGTVELIRRAETFQDYVRTLDFQKNILF